jgi:hypothetical protein
MKILFRSVEKPHFIKKELKKAFHAALFLRP